MNTRKHFETITIHGISGKQTEDTEIISAALLARNTVARQGRVSVDADTTGRTAVLNWLLGDLSQLLDADEAASTAASAGAYAL